MTIGLWMVLGCGTPSPLPSTAPSPTDTASTHDDSAPDGIEFVTAPLLSPAPLASTPLGFVATTETDGPGVVELSLSSEAHRWHHRLPVDGTRQSWPVVGLLADTTYEATFQLPGDDASRHTTTVTTPPLPHDLPRLELLHAEPSRMEPGLTLLAPAAPDNQGSAYILVVDEQGRVVWFHRVARYAGEARLDEQGDLVYLATRRQVEVIDLLGQPITTVWPTASRFAPEDAVGPNVAAFHHDVHPLPNGDLLGLGVEERVVADMPSSETDPDAPTMTASVAGDVVLRMDRTGQVLDRFDLLDLLDPQRIGYDSLTSTYWHYLFGEGTVDWSHANNVVHREDVDDYVISVRNQDAVVAIDGASGQLTWLLAPPAHWGPSHQDLLLRPVDDRFRYPYHPHGPAWTPQGTLLLFDNGTHGASAYEPPVPEDERSSRVVELAIDVVAGTVEEVWSYEPGLYAPAMGDADPLPTTGHVLAVFGALDPPDLRARIQEVTRTTPPERVFELGVYGSEVREAERIPSLYPLGGPRPL